MSRLRTFASEFDGRFERLLRPIADAAPEIVEAVRYSALAPGKRIRPFLVVRSCELVGGNRDRAWHVAAGVECVHAFSLIHDDLPAMDDDDLRRGRPTSHKRFGEATAILAGDALAFLGIEMLLRHEPDKDLAARMALVLVESAGWGGMIGGQSADISSQSRPPDLKTTEAIHDRKTAALFAAACKMGAMVGAGSRLGDIESLARFGRSFGRAFQIADDLLDLTETADNLGKRTGKDAVAGKQTYAGCVGVDEGRRTAQRMVDAAIEELAGFGDAASDLRDLVRHVVDRAY